MSSHAFSLPANAEMAPPHFRGACNIMFQLFCTVGILGASVINWGALLHVSGKTSRATLCWQPLVMPIVLQHAGTTTRSSGGCGCSQDACGYVIVVTCRMLHACAIAPHVLQLEEYNALRDCAAGVQDHTQGWRLSLGLAVVPALIFTIGGACQPNTPASMLLQDPSVGERAEQVLTKHALDSP